MQSFQAHFWVDGGMQAELVKELEAKGILEPGESDDDEDDFNLFDIKWDFVGQKTHHFLAQMSLNMRFFVIFGPKLCTHRKD